MACPSPEGDGDIINWVDFCEKHAKTAASNFARSFVCYASSHTPSSSTWEHKEFLSKFIDSFVEHFEDELIGLQERAIAGGGLSGPSALNGFHSVPHDSASTEESTDYFDQHPPGSKSPRIFQRPFFRRLSFKALKKGKGFFYRQTSTDEAEGGAAKNIKFDKSSKTRLAKIVVECRKEGIVNYLIGENPDGTQKWEKCRLALVKTVGGYMLEFYSPPKSVKPKSGVFCFLITEARETSDLEMPEFENTFVLKADNNMEYVIEAHDVNDMRSWLATVKYCMRSANLDSGDSHSLIGSLSEGRLHKGGCSSEDEPPELPPRLLEGASNSNFELCSPGQEEGGEATEFDLSSVLREYPWFHGTLPRSEAADLVLHPNVGGHGVFLVRQSETRKGEFVLTFNFHGRVKHLRMTINDNCHCRIQHLWFTSIFDMLENFRTNPIPLESGGSTDVTLTQYVIHFQPSAPSTLRSQGGSHSDRRPPPTPEVREIVAHGGPIRIRTESLERLERLQEASDSSGSAASAGAGRAVENTYSFV